MTLDPTDRALDRPTTIGLAVVNVGAPTLLADASGTRVWSGIDKAPVADGVTLWLSSVNLAGDGQADLRVHGGPDKAVYAYPSEHLGPWARELDAEPVHPAPHDTGQAGGLGHAPFGENLSTVGVTESEVCIGDVWQWGEATLEVCQPRWPCYKLALHRGRADIQQRMRANGRTGWYLRVLEPGEVTTGSDIEVTRPDPAGLTVMDAHLAMGDRHLTDEPLARALAEHPSLAAEWRDPLRDRLAR